MIIVVEIWNEEVDLIERALDQILDLESIAVTGNVFIVMEKAIFNIILRR
jgi:hypothetical protein